MVTDSEGSRYICTSCGGFLRADRVKKYTNDKKTHPECPDCGLPMELLCPEAHACTCILTVHSGIRYCEKCGAAICPDCGSHDVAQISRVTGYMQEVRGWNASKQQELKDRHRVDVINGIPT